MTPDLRRCLTIKPPWSWLIIRPDLAEGTAARAAWLQSPERKDIENRTWKHSYRGTLYIHSGLTLDVAGYRGVAKAFPNIPLPPLADFKPGAGSLSGGIIGRVRFVGIISLSNSPWFTGPLGWQFEFPEPVPFEPLTGAVGIFLAGGTRPLKAKPMLLDRNGNRSIFDDVDEPV